MEMGWKTKKRTASVRPLSLDLRVSPIRACPFGADAG